MVGNTSGDESDVEQVCGNKVDSENETSSSESSEMDSENETSSSESSEMDIDSPSPSTNKSESPQRIVNCEDENFSDSNVINNHSNDLLKRKHGTSEETNTGPNDTSPKNCEVKDPTTNELFDEHLVSDVEDGECSESEGNQSKTLEASELESDGQNVEEVPEELEEGEILDDDEDESKLEEIKSKIVCKHFLRGQCSWGDYCKFLHSASIDKESYNMLEDKRPVVPRMVYGVTRPYQVENVWERGLRKAKEAMYNSLKNKECSEGEESDSENGSTEEIKYTRHPPTRNYSPEEHRKKRQTKEYSKARHREQPGRSSDYNEGEDKDLHYKSKRVKREVSVPKEGWSDPWMRSKSSVGANRKRNYSSSSYSSRSSSRGSSASKSSSGSYKKRGRCNREKRSSPQKRSLSRRSKRASHVDEFGRSRKKVTDINDDVMRGKKRKQSIKSVYSSSSGSSSSDTDSSESKRSRSKHADLKNVKVSKIRKRSSSPAKAPKSATANKGLTRREILLKRLEDVESAITNYEKKKEESKTKG